MWNFLDQGSIPCPLKWKYRVLTAGPTRNSPATCVLTGPPACKPLVCPLPPSPQPVLRAQHHRPANTFQIPYVQFGISRKNPDYCFPHTQDESLSASPGDSLSPPLLQPLLLFLNHTRSCPRALALVTSSACIFCPPFIHMASSSAPSPPLGLRSNVNISPFYGRAPALGSDIVELLCFVPASRTGLAHSNECLLNESQNPNLGILLNSSLLSSPPLHKLHQQVPRALPPKYLTDLPTSGPQCHHQDQATILLHLDACPGLLLPDSLPPRMPSTQC